MYHQIPLLTSFNCNYQSSQEVQVTLPIISMNENQWIQARDIPLPDIPVCSDPLTQIQACLVGYCGRG